MSANPKYDVTLLCRLARAVEEATVKRNPASVRLYLHDEVVDLMPCHHTCGRHCLSPCAGLPNVINPGPHLDVTAHTIHRCRHHWYVEYTGEAPEPLTYPDVSDT